MCFNVVSFYVNQMFVCFGVGNFVTITCRALYRTIVYLCTALFLSFSACGLIYRRCWLMCY